MKWLRQLLCRHDYDIEAIEYPDYENSEDYIWAEVCQKCGKIK